ncbi:MAG: hypothetical protein HY553_07815 [Elusimicrobia bacterium]|nr:hypothetical protein [Elusimicrobiota bacterium]
MNGPRLFLLAVLAASGEAAAQGGKAVTVAPLAGAQAPAPAVGALARPVAPAPAALSLTLPAPLAAARAFSVSPAGAGRRPAATRAVLNGLGAELAARGTGGEDAAQPIAAALDGSDAPATARTVAPAATLQDAAVGFTTGLKRAVKDATPAARPAPPAPGPVRGWRTRTTKALLVGSGWALLVAGAVLWLLPIPGPTAMILGGLSLLSPHYAWAGLLQARVVAATLFLSAWALARLSRARPRGG